MPLNRTIPPPVADPVNFDYLLPAINRHLCQNGLPLYWLNAGVQDVVEINWVFPAGIWYESVSATAHAVAGLLKNGTSTRTAHQLNEAFEFYGASLRVTTGNDFASVMLHTLTKHLPHVLPVVHEILTDAIFPEEELRLYQQNTTQRLMVSLRQCEFVANRHIDALIFGEAHPYGRYSTIETIEALSRENILAFYQTYYNLSNVRIFMAGHVGSTEVDLIEKVFGSFSLTAIPSSPTTVPTPAPSGHQLHLTNDPSGIQGAIRIGSAFPNRHHPDFAPMVVLNTLFGGYFGSRLMSNIREEKGFTYGIYSSLAPNIHAGSLTISTEVGREVIEPAIKEIYHEMERLCLAPASEEELLLVKNYLLGNLLGDLDGPFQVLQRWRMLILNGLTEEHFNRSISIYKTVDTKTLQQLAQHYFLRENFYEVVVI